VVNGCLALAARTVLPIQSLIFILIVDLRSSESVYWSDSAKDALTGSSRQEPLHESYLCSQPGSRNSHTMQLGLLKLAR
jgi:hypothetical protein